jgi:hypothetical protein
MFRFISITSEVSVLRAEGAGTAGTVKQPATAASAKDALEPGSVQTAKEQAANRWTARNNAFDFGAGERRSLFVAVRDSALRQIVW